MRRSLVKNHVLIEDNGVVKRRTHEGLKMILYMDKFRRIIRDGPRPTLHVLEPTDRPVWPNPHLYAAAYDLIPELRPGNNPPTHIDFFEGQTRTYNETFPS